ncbi:MAG: hypothetical protein N4J56_000885 [Chroococcidiopsis sp. SAG 2025]|uniref:YybH family protein n=1 Tax=Chroococcidiopsis sp. SAG 2025 TaxID=171389 RepID=UPI0029373A04|nr:nuclear transport factor 2 family protein [Chroococcidiopsis sp. SAG 2025]MDV2991231.1 hypothetical protein [Chroococcidiopsis sp. SAG 2025]
MSLAKTLKTLLAIAFLAIMLSLAPAMSANAQTIQMDRVEQRSLQENDEFKQLINASYAAWNTHDPEQLSKFYAKDADLVFYDALPLQYKGWTDYKAGIQSHLFNKMPKFQLAANDDVQVNRRDNLAWKTFTWHLSAQLNDGTPIESDGRQTDIWEHRNGQWLIIHEHISAPVSL